ncbi:SOSS complex subunit B1 isoform X1 [Nematostella vectensis]|uniref:SOSS complex subunit B1 isoform X1 n=1 Tax=Nematostella vectensis TaxID=45351 RepID=UPI0020773967|nr:SOSS complex subunit B1 isoform X1 [Nematostella vectensis]
MADEKPHLSLTDIKDVRASQKNLHCVFIVLEIGKPNKTKDGHNVRSCRVADKTASINVSIWDEFGEFLQPGDILRLTRGYAAVWKGCLTLYTGRNGHLEKLGDFCMVFSEIPNMSEPSNIHHLKQGEQGRNSPTASQLPSNQSSRAPAGSDVTPSSTQPPPFGNTQRFHPYQRPEQPSPNNKTDQSRDPRLRGSNGNGGSSKPSNASSNEHSPRNIINSNRDPRTRR